MAANILPPLYLLHYKTLKVYEFNGLIRRKVEESHRGVVFAFWHNRFFPLIQLNRDRGIAILVSLSADGDLIARILTRFGYRVVRGSSSRGGISGLKALVKVLKSGGSVAVMPDGPRGPRYQVKEGVLLLSRATEAPIIPASCVYSAYWELGSWDRFRVPKPFSKVVVGYGEPIFVPRGASLKEYARLLERRLFELDEQLEVFLRGL